MSAITHGLNIKTIWQMAAQYAPQLDSVAAALPNSAQATANSDAQEHASSGLAVLKDCRPGAGQRFRAETLRCQLGKRSTHQDKSVMMWKVEAYV